jgi:hypothetical protein
VLGAAALICTGPSASKPQDFDQRVFATPSVGTLARDFSRGTVPVLDRSCRFR